MATSNTAQTLDSYRYGLMLRQLKPGKLLQLDYGNSTIKFDGLERTDPNGIYKDGTHYRFDDLSHPQYIDSDDPKVESRTDESDKTAPTIDNNAYMMGQSYRNDTAPSKASQAARDNLSATLGRAPKRYIPPNERRKNKPA